MRRELRVRYGAERAEDMLEATAELIAAHAGLRQVLAIPGFGGSSAAQQFMEGLIEHVRKTEHL